MAPLYRIPLMANLRQLHLQCAHEHKVWQADWHQVVFSDESRFNLWNHDGHIRVRRYAGLEFGVRFRILDDPICYKLRVISIATGTYVKYPKFIPSFKTSLECSFSRIMQAHMLFYV
ncbi:UNVERIFIED_CONTAM: hypothetical protein NCL1_56017 [Trichonephila clavipes]